MVLIDPLREGWRQVGVARVAVPAHSEWLGSATGHGTADALDQSDGRHRVGIDARGDSDDDLADAGLGKGGGTGEGTRSSAGTLT